MSKDNYKALIDLLFSKEKVYKYIDDEYIYISDSKFIIRIRKELCIFSYNINATEVDTIGYIFENENNKAHEYADIVDEFKEGKETDIILNSLSYDVCFNKKYLKYFPSDISFRVSGERNPILVENNEANLIGIIMPIWRI